MSRYEERRRPVAIHHGAIRLGPVDKTIHPDGLADQLINDRLKSKQTFLKSLKITPRRYQNELARKTIEQNSIIYLGTGLGKTFITVLLLNSAQIDEQIQRGLKGVFLAPTQDLIKQQAEYINKHVRYRIKIFCGRTARCGQHIDHWQKDIWQSELQHVDLLFMTPQIFCNAISTSLLDWSEFAVVIFDEFHHACPSKNKGSGSPYSQTLEHYKAFYQTRASLPKPRMIGLTASLINSMPKNRQDIENQVRHLETTLSGKCFTDIEVQETRPTMILHRFSSLKIAPENDLLTRMMTGIVAVLNEALNTKKAEKIFTKKSRNLTSQEVKILSFYNRLRLASMGFSIKPSNFPRVLDGMIAIRQRCGLWHLRTVCSLLIDAIEKHSLNSCLNAEVRPIYKSFGEILRKIHHTLDAYLMRQSDKGVLSCTRPKSKALLDVLRREFERVNDESNDKSTFSCIVFVRSRLEVVATNKWLQEMSLKDEYSFIKCDYAIGLAATMSSKYACITKRKPSEQSSMLNKFRDNSLNVIVTTSVLEEGIDLPICSTVVRYDSPNNFREFVQSRGRARQSVSTYVSLCELAMSAQTREALNKFNDFEMTLKDLLVNRNIAHSIHQQVRTRGSESDTDLDSQDFFLTRDGLVRISTATAKTILNMYCNRLSKNTPFTEGVRFDRIQPTPETFLTILYLPSGCPLNEGIRGRPKSSKELSDSSAAVAAIKCLYDAGELDEHAVPTRVSETNIDNLLATQDLKPIIEILDESLEGRKLIVNERELSLFTPRLLQVDPLHRDCSNRTYKLLRIRFTAVPNSAREETRPYFEQSTYGLIVDSRISNDFVPPSLCGHYGKFKVEYLQLHENWSITSAKDHRDYLNYTWKFIRYCLSMRDLDQDSFARHCLFYLIPLDDKNRPDLRKMRASFGMVQDTKFHKEQIVKIRHYYREKRERDPRQRQPMDFDRPMLVRAIRHDMNAQSLIRSGNQQRTLFDYAEERYGRGVVKTDPQQVIEVMPLSKEFASVQEDKSNKKKEFCTDSIFYLEQFLQPFDSDAASVFQAFLMPEIIYNLYLNYVAHQLDNKFRIETEFRRNDDQPLRPKEPTELVLNRGHLSESGLEEIEQGQISAEDTGRIVGLENQEPGDESDEDSDSITDSELSYQSSHTDYDDDFDNFEPSYKDLVKQQSMNLNENDDKENMKRWDLDQYSVADLRTLKYEVQDYENKDAMIEYSAQCADEFDELERDVSAMQVRLVDQLKAIECSFTGDAWDLDEASELQKRTAKVDRTIEPPVKFDRGQGFLGNQPQLRGVLEALTQRRAGQPYNLEGLENIGDSYLKYVVSVILFKRLEGNEGLLTSARSRLTSNNLFCYLAKKRSLGSYAITGALNRNTMPFLFGRAIKQHEIQNLSNRMRPKDLADLFESLVGGYFLYKGEFEAILAIEWLGLDIFKEGTFDEFHSDTVVFSKAPTAFVGDDLPTTKQYYDHCKVKYRKFEEIIGYDFNDVSYLVQAFTHASSLYKCTRSYERLEFLGDSILDLVNVMTLVKCGCKFEPGQLTSSKSSLVNNSTFARLAMLYKFDLFIMHGNSELQDELAKVRLAMEEDPEMGFIEMVDFDRIAKLLADVFESVAAAIYLDSGNSLDTVWSVYYPMMKRLIDQEIEFPTKNIVQQLYETFPGYGRINFETYDVKTSEGDSVGVKCTIPGFGEFEGRGLSKKQAKLRAVQAVMRQRPSPELKAQLDAEYRSRLGIREGRSRPGNHSFRGSGSRGHRRSTGRPSYRHRGDRRF